MIFYHVVYPVIAFGIGYAFALVANKHSVRCYCRNCRALRHGK